MHRRINLAQYCANHGIVNMDGLARQWYDPALAMDSGQLLSTLPNSGLPAYLTNVHDPEVIRVLTAPTVAQEIAGGERQKGSWVMATTTVAITESTGHVTAYGDYNTGGRVGSNTNWLARDSYGYQTMAEWGEKEIDSAMLGNINVLQEIQIATAETMNRFLNASYFYGVANLRCYGLHNDPNLPDYILPTQKASGGMRWDDATQNEILDDVRALFSTIQQRVQGLIRSDDAMTLALSPMLEVKLMTFNAPYNTMTAEALIKKVFPKMRIISAPEYSTGAGELVQLFINKAAGRDVVYVAFTEKERSHRLVAKTSSHEQKKSGGTWGAIIRYPHFIQSMIGL